jgi:acetyl-CoA acyltransferase
MGNRAVIKDERPAWISNDEGPRSRTPPPKPWASCAQFSRQGGSVTAGNSSQMSDGAGAVLLASEKRDQAIQPDADGALGGLLGRPACVPEVMGIGPKDAIPKALAARLDIAKRRHRLD